MTTTTRGDRMVLDWLATDRGSLDAAAVDAAITRSHDLRQRRGLRAFLVGAQPWPATTGLGVRSLPAGLRVAIAVVLVTALVGAGVWAGSRLLERPRTVLPAPYGPAGNGLVAFSAGNDLFLGDPNTGSSRLLATGVGSYGLFDPSGSRIATARTSPPDTICYGPPPVPACTADILVTSIGGRSVVVTREPLPWPAVIRDWSGDGRSILVSGPGETMVIVAADGSGTRPLRAVSNWVTPQFSPSDTASIWTDEPAGDGFRPVRVGLDGQVLTRLDALSGRVNLAYALSADGQRIAVAGNGSGVAIVRLDGTVERSIDLGPDVDQIVQLEWSPDGRALVAEVLRGLARTLTVLDPQGVAPGRAIGPRASSSCTWAPDGAALLCADEEVGWWIADLAGGGRLMTWPGTQISTWPSWQRLAVEEGP